jgi:beta-N-acetylhexosaminidase
VRSIERNQLGQLCFVRLRESCWSKALGRELRRASPAGVVLPDVLPPSVASTSELLHRIAHALDVPPFLAVRQEGGAHDPLHRLLRPLPSPRAASARGPIAVTRLGELIGEALCLLGFNMNFAPRLDLSTALSDKSFGAQTFGADPGRVTGYGEAFLHGLECHSVLACGKYFPGLGSVTDRPGSGRATSAKPMAALWREDLTPFRKLLPELPMVLISAARYKAYDFDNSRPACFSSAIVTGLLREKLGYHGLALAHHCEPARDTRQAAVESLIAGCDLFIVDQGEDFERAQQGLNAGLESGKLSIERAEQALKRVSAAKRRLVVPSGKVASSAWKRLNRRFENFTREFRFSE